MAWTRSSSAPCSWVGEDLFSFGGTPETSVFSRATENFRDAQEEARGGADSCSLERQCENGTPLNFVRAVRGTDGHTEGTTSRTCPELRAPVGEIRVHVGPRSPTTAPEALETNGKPPGTDSELPRVLATQTVTANTPEKMLRRTLVGVTLNDTGRSDQVVEPLI